MSSFTIQYLEKAQKRYMYNLLLENVTATTFNLLIWGMLVYKYICWMKGQQTLSLNGQINSLGFVGLLVSIANTCHCRGMQP